jgi:hypothetical protein
MYLPEMADERLAKPRARAEAAVVNFMMMVLFVRETKWFTCGSGLEDE